MACWPTFPADGAVVRETARAFFRSAPRWRELPASLFLWPSWALLVGGGLNNDWDLTYRVIELLMVPLAPVLPYWHPDPGEHFQRTMGRSYPSWPSPARAPARAGPAPTAGQSLPARPLPRRGGRWEPGQADLPGGLPGAARFRATYGLPPARLPGKVETGSASWPRRRRRAAWPRATGHRHRQAEAEAGYFLDRFALRALFGQVLTLEDCQREERRVYLREGPRAPGKAAPFPPDALAGRLKAGRAQVLRGRHARRRRPGARAVASASRPGPGRPGPGSGPIQGGRRPGRSGRP